MTVNRTSQVEPGWYSIHGDDTEGLPVLPQIFLSRTKALQTYGRPHMRGTLVYLLEGRLYTRADTIHLDTYNVYDDSSGMISLLKAWRLSENGRWIQKHDTRDEAWQALMKRARSHREVEMA